MARPVARGAVAATPKVYGPRARRVGLAWVIAVMLVAGALGTVVSGSTQYVVAWVFIGALVVNPAFLLSASAAQRAAPADRRFWRLFTTALAFVMLTGISALGHVASAGALGAAGLVLGVPLVIAASLCFLAALFDLVRTHTTIRANAIDVVQAAMAAVALLAFLPILWGDRPIATEALWFAVPCALAIVAVVVGQCWSFAMFERVEGQVLPNEVLGFTIGAVCGLNAVLQTAQGLTGFSLPAAPLLVAQAGCFGVVMLLPLYLPSATPHAYTMRPPIDQTRVRLLDAFTIVLLVVLGTVAALQREVLSWAPWYVAGIAVVLVVLATVRGRLAAREIRDLYAQLEEAAEARRRLLADVLRSAERDRHRVAAQLHEQATALFVGLSSFAGTAAGQAGSTPMRALRTDLEHQADALRELMLAVRPLESADATEAALSATLTAFLDGLSTHDTRQPQLRLEMAPEVAMDWTTETIVLRILQEALGNVVAHAGARSVVVTLDTSAHGLDLTVQDDGVGFSPDALIEASGIEVMRSFATHLGGTVDIDSEPGTGTTVRASLGLSTARRAPAASDQDDRRSHLRLVTDELHPTEVLHDDR